MSVRTDLMAAISDIDILSPPREYLSEVLRALCERLGFRFGTVLVLNEEKQAIGVSSYALPPDYMARAMAVKAPLITSPSGEAIATGKIVVVPNALEEPRLLPWYETSVWAGLRTIVWIPLLNKREAFGTCNLYDSKVREVTQDERDVMAQVATLISMALVSNRYLDQLNQRTQELHASNDELSRTIARLTATQRQMAVQEKLASFGELTAGIAHEIRNPLNFIHNFAELSTELCCEQREVLTRYQESNDPGVLDELDDMTKSLAEHANTILLHSKRAERIVKLMLEHSRGGGGQRRVEDLNILVAEYVDLAIASARSKKDAPPIDWVTNREATPLMINTVAQDLGRVLVNLLNNAVYAVRAKKTALGGEYRPTVSVSTRRVEDCAELRIRDNGGGIPVAVREKIFQPFFTTKPTGEGTGLGLSISYEIVVHGNGGDLRCESEEGAFTEFIIVLKMVQS